MEKIRMDEIVAGAPPVRRAQSVKPPALGVKPPIKRTRRDLPRRVSNFKAGESVWFDTGELQMLQAHELAAMRARRSIRWAPFGPMMAIFLCLSGFLTGAAWSV